MRFTPLEVPAIIRLAQMTKRIIPISVPAKARLMFVSRTNEMNGEAGVRYWSLGNCSARTAKMTPTSVWPRSFSRERSPRLRCLEILMKSSRKPTMPSPVMRNRTSTPLAVSGVQRDQCAAA